MGLHRPPCFRRRNFYVAKCHHHPTASSGSMKIIFDNIEPVRATNQKVTIHRISDTWCAFIISITGMSSVSVMSAEVTNF
mmetsp:Transcript_6483/g.12217  ORF Transcript_6483/g.12217 Transcript_6483/m.12217 type:complete len:80 (+) Transcript_6483:7640-7879(+)